MTPSKGNMKPECPGNICAPGLTLEANVSLRHGPPLRYCLYTIARRKERKRAYSSCCIGERRGEKRRALMYSDGGARMCLKSRLLSHSDSVFKSIIVVVAVRKSGQSVSQSARTMEHHIRYHSDIR